MTWVYLPSMSLTVTHTYLRAYLPSTCRGLLSLATPGSVPAELDASKQARRVATTLERANRLRGRAPNHTQNDDVVDEFVHALAMTGHSGLEVLSVKLSDETTRARNRCERRRGGEARQGKADAHQPWSSAVGCSARAREWAGLETGNDCCMHDVTSATRAVGGFTKQQLPATGVAHQPLPSGLGRTVGSGAK